MLVARSKALEENVGKLQVRPTYLNSRFEGAARTEGSTSTNGVFVDEYQTLLEQGVFSFVPWNYHLR